MEGPLSPRREVEGSVEATAQGRGSDWRHSTLPARLAPSAPQQTRPRTMYQLAIAARTAGHAHLRPSCPARFGREGVTQFESIPVASGVKGAVGAPVRTGSRPKSTTCGSAVLGGRTALSAAFQTEAPPAGGAYGRRCFGVLTGFSGLPWAANILFGRRSALAESARLAFSESSLLLLLPQAGQHHGLMARW